MNLYKNKRVFLTGHTGFKGSWLALWLKSLGAEVFGFALEPPTEPSFFKVCGIESVLTGHTMGDVRDSDCVLRAMQAAQPDIVFHLAAQPLVRHSYVDPVGTYAVNVMGVVHVLEAVRQTSSVKAVVNVTTDKCYENREWVWAYRENEAMGGHDPYSSSKGCAELVTAAYRRSFLSAQGVGVATARAGNVIGGGDWAKDRLIPDFLRALDKGETLTIRSPNATRPWQHVLEPLSGYLTLGAHLLERNNANSYDEAWNFGPEASDAKPVQWIVEHLCKRIQGTAWECDTAAQLHEAHFLSLDSSKAKVQLRWKPRWNLEQTLDRVIEWHQAWRTGADMQTISLKQIKEYQGLVTFPPENDSSWHKNLVFPSGEGKVTGAVEALLEERANGK